MRIEGYLLGVLFAGNQIFLFCALGFYTVLTVANICTKLPSPRNKRPRVFSRTSPTCWLHGKLTVSVLDDVVQGIVPRLVVNRAKRTLASTNTQPPM